MSKKKKTAKGDKTFVKTKAAKAQVRLNRKAWSLAKTAALYRRAMNLGGGLSDGDRLTYFLHQSGIEIGDRGLRYRVAKARRQGLLAQDETWRGPSQQDILEAVKAWRKYGLTPKAVRASGFSRTTLYRYVRLAKEDGIIFGNERPATVAGRASKGSKSSSGRP
jgi:hypothetical protein